MASSCDFACVGNLGQQEATNSLFVCAAGEFWCLHSLFLEAGPGAKHLVIEMKTSRGKAQSARFSYQYSPIS